MWFRKKRRAYLSSLDLYPTQHRGGEIADFTYGKVWTRLWRNRGRDGSVYYRISFDYLHGTKYDTKLSKSFPPEALRDLERAIVRIQHWLNEHKNY